MKIKNQYYALSYCFYVYYNLNPLCCGIAQMFKQI